MKCLYAGCLSLAFAGSAAHAAEELTLEQVLASSRVHFPRIQSAVQEKLIREGRVQSALGEFDLALEQSTLVWADGYYDGMAVDNRLVKPLGLSNAKVFAGYRVSNDDFPVYQQDRVTNGGGEFNVGLVFSLWRDRAIDERRFELLSTRLGVREADYELTLARVLTQRLAAGAYWRWVAAGQRVAIYRQLVELSGQRMAALERRVDEGDVAAIYVVENRQNLLLRKALLTNAERDQVTAAIDLSLYFRDADGMSVIPTSGAMPRAFPRIDANYATTADGVATVLARRPEFAQLDTSLERERARLQVAENALLPRVDVGLKAAHDLGDGERSRRGLDALVDVQVSIPLERRRGQGLVAQARAKIRQLELERHLLTDQVANEIRKIENNIEAARQFVAITAQEVSQAALMETAEHTRFAAGASDFFLVNLREERSADARARNLDSKLGFFNSLIDYQAATIDLAALGLAP